MKFSSLMQVLVIFLMSSVGAFTLFSCGSSNTAATEQAMTEENQEGLLKAQPPVRLKWSLERENINKRTDLWNDPDKVAYIYLVDYGKVMAFFIIKGKVSSVNSQITNPEQKVRGYQSSVVMPSPAEDGSYGTNGDGIFFFTTDGTYVEWAGSYMLCDKPLKLSTPPQIVRSIK